MEKQPLTAYSNDARTLISNMINKHPCVEAAYEQVGATEADRKNKPKAVMQKLLNILDMEAPTQGDASRYRELSDKRGMQPSVARKVVFHEMREAGRGGTGFLELDECEFLPTNDGLKIMLSNREKQNKANNRPVKARAPSIDPTIDDQIKSIEVVAMAPAPVTSDDTISVAVLEEIAASLGPKEVITLTAEGITHTQYLPVGT